MTWKQITWISIWFTVNILSLGFWLFSVDPEDKFRMLLMSVGCAYSIGYISFKMKPYDNSNLAFILSIFGPAVGIVCVVGHLSWWLITRFVKIESADKGKKVPT